MDAQELQFHAQELLRNPVFAQMCAKMEQEAVERCISAKYSDHEARLTAAADIRAIRTFRRNCEALARNNPAKKAAPV